MLRCLESRRTLLACATVLAACLSAACDEGAGSRVDAGVRDAAASVDVDAGRAHGNVDAGSGPDAGAQLACRAADDCPEPAGGAECVRRACRGGSCSVDYAAAGTELEAQTSGDCRRQVCDGAGAVIAVDDDGDVEMDDHECTQDECSAGSVLHAPLPAGSACTQDDGHVCDDQGRCVECVLPGDCASGVCQDGACRPPLCGNEMLDSGEADVDCGGGCGACPPGSSCAQPSDCAGMECTGDRCVANCRDGIRNNGEADVDCGNDCDADCANGRRCASNADCASGFCRPSTDRCATPSCTDEIRNGDETATDCGGSCPACPISCQWNDHCGAHDVCYPNVCVHSVNGCSIDTATDLRGMPQVTIDFDENGYVPSCLVVTMYTDVTFNGSFAEHPLSGGQVKNGAKEAAASGPFITTTQTGTSHTFSMDACATFPFYCDEHALSGMTGAIFVVAP